MRTIRASEIGGFLFCQRAWWYARSGETPDNLEALAYGNELHQRHGQQVLRSGCLRSIALGLILIALILIAITLTARAL